MGALVKKSQKIFFLLMQENLFQSTRDGSYRAYCFSILSFLFVFGVSLLVHLIRAAAFVPNLWRIFQLLALVSHPYSRQRDEFLTNEAVRCREKMSTCSSEDCLVILRELRRPLKKWENWSLDKLHQRYAALCDNLI